jgi:murein DD-endopeptidase MepM/ murein hydrolase activator NlpD
MNLFKNPSFEEGWYHHQGIAEIQVPGGWEFWFAPEDFTNPVDDAPHSVFRQPEMRVLSTAFLPEHEWEDYIAEGIKCVKIFKAHGAWRAGLYQGVNLMPGTYAVSLQIYGDLYKDYIEEGPGKVWANDPGGRDGTVECSVFSDSAFAAIPAYPVDPQSIMPGYRVNYNWAFSILEEGKYDVQFTFMCPFPLMNAGLFLDMASVKRVETIPPDPPTPGSGRGQPREQYARTYVLLPPDGDTELALAVTALTFPRYRATVGGSADDAGIGNLDVRSVVALNPDNWQGSLEDFYKEHYPDADYIPVHFNNTFLLSGRLEAAMLRGTGIKLTYPLTGGDPMITAPFGQPRETYTHSGLDLRASWDRDGDEVLAAYTGKVVKVGEFPPGSAYGTEIKTQTELPDGRKMTLQYAHLVPWNEDGIYIDSGDIVKAGDKIGRPDSTGNSTGDHLHFSVKIGDSYVDPAILIDWPNGVPSDPFGGDSSTMLVGLHDEGGGEETARWGTKTVCLVHETIGYASRVLDYEHLARAGVRVIARIQHGYANTREGTIPPREDMQKWVNAVTATIASSRGVFGWVIGNEYNNPTEWPGGYPSPRYVLDPNYYTVVYNSIVRGISRDILISPGALDPYNVVAQEFGQPGDPKDWAETIYDQADRLDFITMHIKTQSNNPLDCMSRATFTHAPLTGRYMHLASFEDQATWIPEKYSRAPIYITELNPQRKSDGSNGWERGNYEWVISAMTYLSGGGTYVKFPAVARISGVAFYRWDGDEWAMREDADVLSVIKAISEETHNEVDVVSILEEERSGREA